MHSSRMRTGRSLTVCRSQFHRGGVLSPGGVLSSGEGDVLSPGGMYLVTGGCLVWGGVWSQGGCLVLGGVWSRGFGPGGGCLVPGGVCWSGTPPC